MSSIGKGASFAVGLTAGMLCAGAVARGADTPSPTPVQVQASTPIFAVGRAVDIDWAQIALAEVPRTPWDLTRPRDGQSVALGTPRALPTMASAATAVISRGLSVFEVRRDLRLRQRHALLAFVRTSGFKLAWRLEF